MLNRITCALVCLLLFQNISAQKKTIDHTVYDGWKTLSQEKISHNGKWIAYIIKPQIGDPTLFVYNAETKKLDSLERVKSFEFGPENNYILAKINPGYDTVRALKLKKTKRDKMPKDSASIWLLEQDSIIKVPNFATYSIPEEGYFLALKKTSSSANFKPTKKRFFLCRLFKKEDHIEKSTKGKDLIVFDTQTGKQTLIKQVSSFNLSENGAVLSTMEHLKIDTTDHYTLQKWVLSDMSKTTIYRSDKDIQDAGWLRLSYNGKYTAFLGSNDTSKNKIYSLYLHDVDSAEKVIDSLSLNMPQGWSVSNYGRMMFSEDEQKLYFGIAPFPYNAPEDTLLDSEKYELDIWHWEDDQLQPQQLLNAKKDAKKTYLSVLHLSSKKWVRLQDEDLSSMSFSTEQSHNMILGSSKSPYELSYSWRMPWPVDLYKIDDLSGTKTKIAEEVGFSKSLSPEGKYAAYYRESDTTWHCVNMSTLEDKTMLISTQEPLFSDHNGSPKMPNSLGVVGWSKGDEKLLINSEHSVWALDPNGMQAAINLTPDYKDNIRYRHIKWDREERHIDLAEPLYFSSFNKQTKSQGFAVINPNEEVLTTLDSGAYALRSYAKARDTNKFIYRKQSFQHYSDLHISDDLTSGKQLSETNPQQKDYLWGTVELTKWTSYKGLEVDGLLYKPENFDSNKNYPLMVYFYERYDDALHNHYVPAPTASIVFPTEYVSNGYVVFIPNIEYTPGAPGASAYDCILSGVDHIITKYDNIDTNKMALQGQSWGGYQTAYLVTQTNRFAAAMAGAPVSNMTSAYGGIRWGSGLSRMFQYERTQSRLGGTLWDSTEVYIENSPVFYTPNVNTPLLMMHNDGDGAVPWYQSIEYFVALRRLGKPAWLLNYNGEEHNLMQRPNRVDLSIRMRQFFDYYLLDKPAPDWLINGLPALDKYKKTGYDLIEKKP